MANESVAPDSLSDTAPEPSDANEPQVIPQPRTQDEPKPAKRLIEVMGRRLVVWLAVGSVIGATALCLVGVCAPTVVPSEIARFFLCLLIAFLFAVFVFTLYPTDYRIEIGKIINIPIVLVGPAALWIGLFLLFWWMLPRGDGGVVFTPGPRSQSLWYGTTWALDWSPAQPVYYKLQSPNGPGTHNLGGLAGFYVQFDAEHDTYTAKIGVGSSRNNIAHQYEADFRRSASTYDLRPAR